MLSLTILVRNLGVIFESNMSMLCLIKSMLSVNLSSHIHDFRLIRSCLNHNTVVIILPPLLLILDFMIATLYIVIFLPASFNRLHFVLNATARAVTRTPQFSLIYHVLKPLHWFKINERIQ
jgi:hypothetical protein